MQEVSLVLVVRMADFQERFGSFGVGNQVYNSVELLGRALAAPLTFY